MILTVASASSPFLAPGGLGVASTLGLLILKPAQQSQLPPSSNLSFSLAICNALDLVCVIECGQVSL